MDYENLVSKEVLNIFNKEISGVFDKKSSQILIHKVQNKFKKVINDSNTTDLLITFFKEDEDLSKLKNALELLYFLKDNIENLESINKKRIANPNNKLYVILWIRLSIEQFYDDEFFDYELFDFYTELFTKYEYLVSMDNFFYDTDIFNVLYKDNLWLTDKSVEMFKELIQKYPNEITFKVFLTQIYIQKRELAKALDLAETLFNSLQKDSPSYLNDKRYLTGMRAEIYYLNEEFDKALTDVNYIIDNKSHKDVIYYLSYYLLRIAINLKSNKQKDADADALILINNLDLFDIFITIDDYNFKIAVEYLEKYIDKLTKLHTKSLNEKTNEKLFYFRSNIGKIEVFGSDSWTCKDGINPFFTLKFNNKKNLTIKIQNITKSSNVYDIELLDNKTINTEDKSLIIEWLNSESKLSEKKIGAKLTNYQYISIVWKLLNKENGIDDPYVLIQ